MRLRLALGYGLVATVISGGRCADAWAQTAASASPAPAASSQPESTSADSVREAGEHTTRALGHFRAHEYTEAIHEFELANRAAPSADFWFNIGRCHELLSHFEEASDFYRRYLRDKVDPPDRADVEHRIQEMNRLAEQARTAALRHTANAAIRFELGGLPRAAHVYLGTRTIERAEYANPISVDPGTYQVRVVSPGYQDWRGQVRVRRGETATAFVTLQPGTQYQTRSGGHILSYIVGALGIGTIGVGAYFGISAASQPPCTGNGDTMMLDSMCARRDLALDADITYGVAVGVLLTAVIVYFVEAGSSHTERVVRVATSVAPSSSPSVSNASPSPAPASVPAPASASPAPSPASRASSAPVRAH